MKKFEIIVEKEGDKFISEGMNTPCKGFCGGAFMILYPMQTALFSGARFGFEENPKCKTGLDCPDKGIVIFSIKLIE